MIMACHHEVRRSVDGCEFALVSIQSSHKMSREHAQLSYRSTLWHILDRTNLEDEYSYSYSELVCTRYQVGL